jgi:hypothetical protein
MVAGFIALLKVTVMAVPVRGRFVAPFAGTVATTVGGEVSLLVPVVKFQVKGAARGFPARSRAPVVMVAV